MSVHKLNSPGSLGLLSTTTFGLIQFLVFAVYPSIADASGIHISTLVLSFTLGSLFFLWSAPFWAKKSDKEGRQKILRIGLLGLATSFALLILITELKLASDLNFGLLLLSRLIYGFTASAIVAVVQAWWRDLDGDVTKNMVSHSIGLNLGRFLAPLAVLLAGGELKYILRSILVWIILLTITSFFVASTKVEKSDRVLASSSWTTFPFLLAFISTLFIGLIHSNLAHQIKTSLVLSSQEASILCSQVLLMSSLIVLFSQSLLKKRTNLKGKTLIRMAILSWFVATLFFGMMTSEIYVWVSIAFTSIGLALMVPGYLSLLGTGGKSAGQMSSIQTLGLTFGGILGYVVLQNNFSFASVLLIICCSLILGALKFSMQKVATC